MQGWFALRKLRPTTNLISARPLFPPSVIAGTPTPSAASDRCAHARKGESLIAASLFLGTVAAAVGVDLLGLTFALLGITTAWCVAAAAVSAARTDWSDGRQLVQFVATLLGCVVVVALAVGVTVPVIPQG